MIPAHAGPVVRTVTTGVLVAVAVAASMLSLTTVVLAGPWVRGEPARKPSINSTRR